MWLWKRNYATYDNSNDNVQQSIKEDNEVITYCFNNHTDKAFDILKEIFAKEEI